MFRTIENADKDEEIVVVAPEKVPAPVITPAVFEAAKDKGTKLTIETKKTEDNLAATFSFEEITNPDIEVSTGITEVKNVNTPDVLEDQASVLGISLEHEGEFPGPAKITIYVGDRYEKGEQVYIYYLNKKGNLEMAGNGPLKVTDDGYVTFTLLHASDYILSSKPMKASKAASLVKEAIKDIGEVSYTPECKAKIDNARSAYQAYKDQYTDAVQAALVENDNAITAAEKQYQAWDNQVKAFKAAVDEFSTEEIKGAMTYAQQKEVGKLEAAYNALNIEQKEALQRDAFDEDYTYEEIYQELRNIRDASKKAENVSQANRVSKLTDQLPATATYSAADKSKIDAARNMYNSVVAETPEAKQLLDNELAKIQKAETEYRNAKRAAYNNVRISLSATQYTYTGGAKTPAVYGLSAFVNGRDYSVAYRNNIKTGKATVTVTAIGDCAGLSAKTATFRITPAKAAISKLKKGKKSFKVTIKSQKSAGVSGYQISYSLKKNKSFKSTTTTKTSKTVKKLKAKKTYYVKVRSYKTIDGKKYYGAYSKVKKIKTK